MAQMVYGSILPAIALVFCEILHIFALPDEREQSALSWRYMSIILAIGVLNLTATVVHSYAFALAGSRLTRRLSVAIFEALLRQEVAFHDRSENRASLLAARLCTAPPLCKGLTSDRLGLVTQGCAGCGFALCVALYINWKLALAMLAFVPLTFLLGVLAGRSSANTRINGRLGNEEAGRITAETVECIRTVVSLGRQAHFVAHFRALFSARLGTQLALLHIQVQT